MDDLLKDNERIDDLQYKGYRIIQKPDEFCFGMDAVLLANFATIKANSLVLDLGTGTGVIPILIAAKTKAKYIEGIDIQSHLCEMAERSTILNNLQDRIKIINGDLKTYNFKNSYYDAITCNPPYKKSNAGVKNPRDSKAIARHEIMCNLEDIVMVSSKALKDAGKLYLIQRPGRLVDIICLMRKYNIEPKRARLVYPKVHKAPNMVLIEGNKNGGEDFRLMEPLIAYHNDGSYSEEIKKIYYGEV